MMIRRLRIYKQVVYDNASVVLIRRGMEYLASTIFRMGKCLLCNYSLTEGIGEEAMMLLVSLPV